MSRLFIFLFLLNTSTLFAEIPTYSSLLIKKAEKLRLHERRYWNLLLHYKKVFGSIESDVDDPSFFISKQGKTNPVLELRATLKEFYQESISGDESKRCKFIARFKWLNKELKFDLTKIRLPKCENYLDWKKEISPASISLVFASYHLNNPASMFGHTFFKINQAKEENFDLLNYTINYAANIDLKEVNPFSYIINGLFGGYRGTFQIEKYYKMLKLYNNIELRNLWEYELDLNSEELERLFNHLWELDQVYFDYFFFKENCSYQLLALLEVARPTLYLQKEFFLWTIPSDTIRLIYQFPGLVKNKRLYPSKWKLLESKLAKLTDSERTLFFSLVDSKLKFPKSWNQISQQKQALILETLYDYFLLNSEEYEKNLLRETLVKRAKLGVVLPEEEFDDIISPGFGHKSSRIGFTSGENSSAGSFYGLNLRLALHDLLAIDSGYLQDSQVEAVRFETRYYSEQDSFELEEFSPVNIISLKPITDLKRAYSWKINTGYRREESKECISCAYYYFNLGVGFTFKNNYGLWYNFFENSNRRGEVYNDYFQIGAGFRSGLLIEATENWKLNAEAAVHRFHYGEEGFYHEYLLRSRYSLTLDQEVRIEYKRVFKNQEIQLGMYFYY